MLIDSYCLANRRNQTYKNRLLSDVQQYDRVYNLLYYIYEKNEPVIELPFTINVKLYRLKNAILLVVD